MYGLSKGSNIRRNPTRINSQNAGTLNDMLSTRSFGVLLSNPSASSFAVDPIAAAQNTLMHNNGSKNFKN